MNLRLGFLGVNFVIVLLLRALSSLGFITLSLFSRSATPMDSAPVWPPLRVGCITAGQCQHHYRWTLYWGVKHSVTV